MKRNFTNYNMFFLAVLIVSSGLLGQNYLYLQYIKWELLLLVTEGHYQVYLN